MAFLGSECPFLLLGKLSWCSKLWVILCWGSVAPKSVHGLIDSSLPAKLMTFPHTSHSTVARLVAVQDQCVHTFSSYITGGTVVWGRKGKEGVKGWLGKANTFIQKVDFSMKCIHIHARSCLWFFYLKYNNQPTLEKYL